MRRRSGQAGNLAFDWPDYEGFARVAGMPIVFVEWLMIPTLLISLGLVLARVVYPAGERRMRPFIVAILLGIAADIMVCGSLIDL
jgi:hypothetical protein